MKRHRVCHIVWSIVLLYHRSQSVGQYIRLTSLCLLYSLSQVISTLSRNFGLFVKTVLMKVLFFCLDMLNNKKPAMKKKQFEIKFIFTYEAHFNT